jgi:hypothetical protein
VELRCPGMVFRAGYINRIQQSEAKSAGAAEVMTTMLDG